MAQEEDDVGEVATPIGVDVAADELRARFLRLPRRDARDDAAVGQWQARGVLDDQPDSGAAALLHDGDENGVSPRSQGHR